MSPHEKMILHHTDTTLCNSQKAVRSVTVSEYHTQESQSCEVGRPVYHNFDFPDGQMEHH